MRIGILGTGKMGTGLGMRWARHGHEVMLGSRNAEKGLLIAHTLGPNATGGGVVEAAQFGEAVLLAVPWLAVPDTVRTAGPLRDKVLIDCTNPLAPSNGVQLAIGYTTSAGEEIARLVPDARVVKAFNTVFSHLIHTEPAIDGMRVSIPYCGNDPSARGTVAGLIDDAGFDSIDAGPLIMARTLEPVAVLMIHLGYSMGMGNEIGLRILRHT